MSDNPDNTHNETPLQRGRAALLKNRWLWLVSGVLLGAMAILAIRLASYNPHEVHYHANFAVYIDGLREDFKNPQYYEEVKICDLHGTSPQGRTHMHDHENGVIHVHDAAVTWGQFFENLGWNVGPDFVRNLTTLYQASDDKKLNIMLNGQDLTDVTTITNQIIGDKDRLLLSYGPADKNTLDTQYKSVPSDAAAHNNQNDPASCGGSEAPTFSERWEHAF